MACNQTARPWQGLVHVIKSTICIGILFHSFITKDESDFVIYEHLHCYLMFHIVLSGGKSWIDLENPQPGDPFREEAEMGQL